MAKSTRDPSRIRCADCECSPDECQASDMPAAGLTSAVVGSLVIDPRCDVVFPLEEHHVTIWAVACGVNCPFMARISSLLKDSVNRRFTVVPGELWNPPPVIETLRESLGIE